MLKHISDINCNKSSGGNIPAKVVKMAKKELTVLPITNCINKGISSSTFLDEFKFVNIIPVYKKQDVSDKTSYRTIISQIFEKAPYS